MEGPRPPQNEEFSKVVKFLDHHLRPKVDWSIVNEYPGTFEITNRVNMRVIFEKDEVLSHAVIRPMMIRTGAGLLRVAGLGSVVTSSAHRNQGLSTLTLQSCLEAAAAQKCDFAILWTNLFDFYRRLGFELAGSEMGISIDRPLSAAAPSSAPTVAATAFPGGRSALVDVNPAPESSLRFLQTSQVDPAAIHRLYNQHTVISIRSIEDVRKFLAIPNTNIYTAWGPQGQLKAYAIEGKGADLHDHIHEWGGDLHSLIFLFNSILEVRGKSFTVIAPRHSRNLLRTATAHGLPINAGFLGMIKLVDKQSLFNKIKKYARVLGLPELVIEEERTSEFVLGYRDSSEHHLRTQDERQIVQLLFGPKKPSQLFDFGAEGNLALDRLFPLDFWIWGWDSI